MCAEREFPFLYIEVYKREVRSSEVLMRLPHLYIERCVGLLYTTGGGGGVGGLLCDAGERDLLAIYGGGRLLLYAKEKVSLFFIYRESRLLFL